MKQHLKTIAEMFKIIGKEIWLFFTVARKLSFLGDAIELFAFLFGALVLSIIMIITIGYFGMFGKHPFFSFENGIAGLGILCLIICFVVFVFWLAGPVLALWDLAVKNLEGDE